MAERKKIFLSAARSWATKNGLRGPQAFLRYVMFVFIEQLNRYSDNFVFKGGNLLWVYIKTPRATVDIDFATKNLDTDKVVRQALEQACELEGENTIEFSVQKFAPLAGKGASASIYYRTEEGQANSFDLDIVYAIPTNSTTIPSLIDGSTQIQAASLENIIADKISACYQFKSGNTRMKDFDDLWRIAQFNLDAVNADELRSILAERSLPASLETGWVSNEMEKKWKSHLKRNKGLPVTVGQTILEINSWLAAILS